MEKWVTGVVIAQYGIVEWGLLNRRMLVLHETSISRTKIFVENKRDMDIFLHGVSFLVG